MGIVKRFAAARQRAAFVDICRSAGILLYVSAQLDAGTREAVANFERKLGSSEPVGGEIARLNVAKFSYGDLQFWTLAPVRATSRRSLDDGGFMLRWQTDDASAFTLPRSAGHLLFDGSGRWAGRVLGPEGTDFFALDPWIKGRTLNVDTIPCPAGDLRELVQAAAP